MQQRLLVRSLNGFGGRRGAFHCVGLFLPSFKTRKVVHVVFTRKVVWHTELLKYHSRLKDDCTLVTAHPGAPSTPDPNMPFCTSACNRNSLVAVGDEGGLVHLIESAQGENPGFRKVYLSFRSHDNAVFDLTFSPDDRQLATASGDQTCRIFDVLSQKVIYSLRAHKNSVKQVTFDPLNPFVLASSGRDGFLNIWDLRVHGPTQTDGPDIFTTLAPVRSIEGYTQNNHTPSITAAVWLDSKKIVTACERDAVIKLWDIGGHRQKRKRNRASAAMYLEASAAPYLHTKRRNYGLNSLSLSSDGQRLYALCKDSNVYAYSVNNLSNGPIHAYSHPRLHADSFYVKGQLSRDGQIYACGSTDGVGLLFPTDERYFDSAIGPGFTHAVEEHPAAKHLRVGRGVVLVHGHDREMTGITWNPENELITISDDRQVRCWRKGNGEEAEILRNGGELDGVRNPGLGYSVKDIKNDWLRMSGPFE